MTSDRPDHDGVPLPEAPMDEAAGAAVVRLRQHGQYLAGPNLQIDSFGEVAARVAAAGEPRWLIQGLWPADACGVLAAQEKAGKTWAASTSPSASPAGGPGSTTFPARAPARCWSSSGRVESGLPSGGLPSPPAKGVDPDQLADQLRLCFRVPRLAAPGAGGELAAIQAIQGVCQHAG